MRIVILTSLAMLAFAANSLLNRAALAGGGIDALGFAAIRVTSGAAILSIAFYLREQRLLARPHDLWGVLGLLTYMLAFSLAYVALEAGFGALLLFGAVQLSMFAIGSATGARPLKAEMLGALVAFLGLVYLVAPNLSVGGLGPSLAMIAAGIGWAVFTISGRGAGDPLTASTASFVSIAPITLLVWGFGSPMTPTLEGVVLAMISGGITSAVGYLIWYAVLPKLAVPSAALVQLTVPIIAIAGGVGLLGESFTPRLLIAALLVTLGVAFGIEARRRVAR